MKTRLPLELTHIQNSGIDNTMRSVITGYATICACLPRLHYHQSLVLPTKLWLPPTKMAAIKINLTRPLRCCCSSASNSSMETSLQSSHDQATPSRRTPTPSQARPPILVENLKRNSGMEFVLGFLRGLFLYVQFFSKNLRIKK